MICKQEYIIFQQRCHQLLAEVKFVHDDIIKWKHFPCYWLFVGGIHWSLVNSPHKGQWHGALMFSLICIWKKGWVHNRDAGDLRCHHAHYHVIGMNDITFSTAMTMAKLKSNITLTKYTPYLTLTGKLWGDFCEDFGENWPCYNSTGLYLEYMWMSNSVH